MKYPYKIYIPNNYHHKNDIFLKYYSSFFKEIVNNIDDADIIFSSSVFFEINKYPSKKFIFGPHFSAIPSKLSLCFKNKYNNGVYLMPSKQAMNLWKNHFQYKTLPLVFTPFGVDTERFKPTRNNEERNEVILYYKKRDPAELEFIQAYLKKKEITYKLFEYGKYEENNYFNQLRKTKYIIWVGQHESQGFALQEALSMDVPILVWNAKTLEQEWGNKKYEGIKIKYETIPYWDSRCGEFFYDKEEFEKTFKKFLKNNYSPREFVLENLSFEKCKEKFNKIVSGLIGDDLSKYDILPEEIIQEEKPENIQENPKIIQEENPENIQEQNIQEENLETIQEEKPEIIQEEKPEIIQEEKQEIIQENPENIQEENIQEKEPELIFGESPVDFLNRLQRIRKLQQSNK